MSTIPTRRLGRTEVELCSLGLGGAPIGELYEKLPEDTAQQTLARSYQLGVRYFDTAPWYGHGLSEHRFGHFLRRQAREEFLLSTKVGRVYRAPAPSETVDISPWAGGLPFKLRFDYGYDAIMRSHQDSLHRLGLARVDLLLIHDLDSGYHGSDEGVDARLRELDDGAGWKALAELRSAGLIKAIGAGVNVPGMMPRFLDRFDIDFFLVAMPYTLLDQTPLDEEFPRLVERGVGVIIGAPYASGILATGPAPGATYGYAAAPPEILARTRRVEDVCQRNGVSLRAAALQFPLGHPIVAAVIPGAVSPEQAEQNVGLMQESLPPELWQELKAEGLIRTDAPVPEARARP